MFWGAYEPRVGATWKVLGSDKTVLRVGFGIYHDSSWNQGAQGLWQNPPNLGESDELPATYSTGCAYSTSYCAVTLDQTPELVDYDGGPFNLSAAFSLCPRRKMWPALWAHTPTSRPTSSRAGFTNITPTSSASCPAISCSLRAMPGRSAAI